MTRTSSRTQGKRPRPRVYVISADDPSHEPKLVTPDYTIRQGDCFIHDADYLDRVSKDKLEQFQRLRQPERLRQMQMDIRGLGEYRNGLRDLDLRDGELEMFNDWLREFSRQRAAAPLEASATLPELVDAYETALRHGKRHSQIMRIAKKLLKAIAGGICAAEYFRTFDREHGYDGSYRE